MGPTESTIASRVASSKGETLVVLSPFRWIEEQDISDLRGTFEDPHPIAYGRVRQVTTIAAWSTGSQLRKEYYQRFLT